MYSNGFMISDPITPFVRDISSYLSESVQRISQDPFMLIVLGAILFAGIWILAEITEAKMYK